MKPVIAFLDEVWGKVLIIVAAGLFLLWCGMVWFVFIYGLLNQGWVK